MEKEKKNKNRRGREHKVLHRIQISLTYLIIPKLSCPQLRIIRCDL